MATNVTASAQFALAKVLKPFDNFEDKYQGLDPLDTPLALPGGLDRLAGQEGYDPNLMAMLPIPMGSRILIWLPRLNQPEGYVATATPDYFYTILWRLRSLTEQTTDPERTSAAHFGQRLKGRPQRAGASSSIDTPGDRFVLPVAIESVQIEGASAEPTQVDVNSSQLVVNPPAGWKAPITEKYPGPLSVNQKVKAAGMFSQGFTTFGDGSPTPSDVNAGLQGGPQYDIYETISRGDEMSVLISRDPNAIALGDPGPWDFEGVDIGLSNVLGTDGGTEPILRGLGVYIFTGSAT